MFIKTLATRAANQQKKVYGPSLGMVGLYHPGQKTFHVYACPENEELQDKTYAIEPSRSNIKNTIAYAKNTQRTVRNAVEAMDASCMMAKAKNNEDDPQMLFYLPSAYFSNNKILVNISPFSCRAPELPDNTNVRYPIYAYAPVDAFIVNILTNASSQKKEIFDTVDYFVSRRNPPIHQGTLNDDNLFNKLAEEAYKNPLLDTLTGSFIPASNRELYNENAVEAISYQICLLNHPEVSLYGAVCSLYNYTNKKFFYEPNEIRECLLNDILYALGDRNSTELANLAREKILLRCVSGFRIHDALFDMSKKDQRYTNQRLQIPLYERCCYLLPDDPENKDKENTNWTCMPPLKRVKDEDKKHLFTIRSLALQTPDGKGCCYPKGTGLVSIRSRKKDGAIINYLYLEAGFLTHKATEMSSRFAFADTACDLSDQAIPRSEIAPLLCLDPEEAVNKCYDAYRNAESSITVCGEADEEPTGAEVDVEPTEEEVALESAEEEVVLAPQEGIENAEIAPSEDGKPLPF